MPWPAPTPPNQGFTVAGPDGTISWAIVHKRESTPAELDDLEQKLLARGAELADWYDQEPQARAGEGPETPGATGRARRSAGSAGASSPRARAPTATMKVLFTMSLSFLVRGLWDRR
jgi:hypothetical protein